MLMLLLAVTTWAFEPGTNITSLESLKDGDYVCFKNVGRNKYVYEATDKKMLHGSTVENLSYVWQAHVEDGKYSFSSITGGYISTPLDGQDVYTVSVDDERKDEFTITAHQEDETKWKFQSTNNSLFWDGQDARFVGWYGSGANSRFEIIPVATSQSEIDEYLELAASASHTNECEAIIANSTGTRVGSYTPAAVVPLATALEAFKAEKTTETMNALKSARAELLANGEVVTLSAGEKFIVKCVEDTRGYMVYSTVEGKGSETQAYLANSSRTEYHAPIDADGIYKEWAIVTYEGKNYIYNVEKKQFLSSDGVVKFTATPYAIKFIAIENQLWEIQFESNNRYLSFSPGWGADCVRTEGGIDNGCKFYLDKTGTSVDDLTSATVEATFVNGWRESVFATLGYVGGYSADLTSEIDAVSTLNGITEFEDKNSKVALTPGYYYIQHTGTKKYATYNAGNFVAEALAEGVEPGLKHIMQFVKEGDYTKLKVANVGKYVTLADAPAVSQINAAEFGAGHSFTIEDRGDAKIILKNGNGSVMRTEGNGDINYWWGDTNTTWYLVPVSEVEVSVNDFASICLPFAATVTNATAYAVEETNSTHAVLVEKADIPANEGAILAGNGVATLTIVDEATADWSANKLEGTTVDTYIAGDACVLANGTNGIGLYGAILNKDAEGNDGETHFKNNANKAYLPINVASGAAYYSFRFGEGTTAIENVEVENASNVIYDLTGRRVEAISAPGIYIVNGVKRVVR